MQKFTRFKEWFTKETTIWQGNYYLFYVFLLLNIGDSLIG